MILSYYEIVFNYINWFWDFYCFLCFPLKKKVFSCLLSSNKSMFLQPLSFGWQKVLKSYNRKRQPQKQYLIYDCLWIMTKTFIIIAVIFQKIIITCPGGNCCYFFFFGKIGKSSPNRREGASFLGCKRQQSVLNLQRSKFDKLYILVLWKHIFILS
jgi:hypothetical protein